MLVNINYAHQTQAWNIMWFLICLNQSIVNLPKCFHQYLYGIMAPTVWCSGLTNAVIDVNKIRGSLMIPWTPTVQHVWNDRQDLWPPKHTSTQYKAPQGSRRIRGCSVMRTDSPTPWRRNQRWAEKMTKSQTGDQETGKEKQDKSTRSWDSK